MRKVISFTTLPSRINNIKLVIDALNNQTIDADCIYLWLSKDYKRVNNKIYDLPDFIKNNNKITIKYEDDIGPITKLYYTLKIENDPDTIIVTLDDDVNYPVDWFEKLVNFSEKYPNCAIGYRGRKFKNKKNIKYKNTQLFAGSNIDDMTEVDILTGTWGNLYRRKFFTDDFFDQSKAPENVFFVDDIWINGHLAKNNIKRYVISSNNIKPVLNLANTTSLFEDNSVNENNDKIIEYFKKYF